MSGRKGDRESHAFLYPKASNHPEHAHLSSDRGRTSPPDSRPSRRGGSARDTIGPAVTEPCNSRFPSLSSSTIPGRCERKYLRHPASRVCPLGLEIPTRV